MSCKANCINQRDNCGRSGQLATCQESAWRRIRLIANRLHDEANIFISRSNHGDFQSPSRSPPKFRRLRRGSSEMKTLFVLNKLNATSQRGILWRGGVIGIFVHPLFNRFKKIRVVVIVIKVSRWMIRTQKRSKDTIHGLQDNRRAAPTCCKRFIGNICLATFIQQCRQTTQQTRIAIAPSIYRLLRIANCKNGSRIFAARCDGLRQRLQRPPLRKTGVLKLVQQQMINASIQAIEHVAKCVLCQTAADRARDRIKCASARLEEQVAYFLIQLAC